MAPKQDVSNKKLWKEVDSKSFFVMSFFNFKLPNMFEALDNKIS